MSLDPIRLARELIDIPSITGEERNVAVFVTDLLTQMGLSVRSQEVASSRFNVIAVTEKKPRVILCTHLDTVPPFMGSSEDEVYVRGRGACDTKGILAAMLCAADRLLKDEVRDFGFLLVVGEETDSIGAKVANARSIDLGSEYLVVGEPTESRFVRASKGAFTCVIRFEGTAAHSAYPERGSSAIQKMIGALRQITDEDWGTHPVLGEATVNVGIVRGGDKANIVPAWAEAEMIFRLVTTADEIAKRVGSIAAGFDGAIIRSHGNEPTFMFTPRGAESVVVAFNTDVPHLRDLGKPILFGPGSILDAHSSDEKITKAEIISAVETYRELVSMLLSDQVDLDHA